MSAVLSKFVLDVRLAGERLPRDAAQCLAMAVVCQRLGVPSVAELAFADPAGAWLERIGMGAEMRLSVAGTALFSGDVVSVEHERDGARGYVLRLRAHDRLHRLRKRQQVRGLAEATLADLASAYADLLGVDIHCPALSGRRQLRIQHDESDLDFLVRQGRNAGLYPYLDGETLRMLPLQGEGDPLSMRLGRQMLSARICNSMESLRSQTRTIAWNLRRMCSVVAEEDASRDAVRNEVADTTFAGLGRRTLLNKIVEDEVEAAELARADLAHAAARAVHFSGSAEGDPALRPGRIVALDSPVRAQSGHYAITTALHRFDAEGGYIVELDNAPPKPGKGARVPMFTIGRVQDVLDPERAGRIRAALPLFEDVQTAWLPVLSLAAGEQKGLVVLPEPGDDVLLVFPDGDPVHGIVLGGLYGERLLPGELEGNPRNFTFVSAGGQKITLHGDRPQLRIETVAGDVLELGPEGSSLTTQHDLLLAAPGRRLTLRAATIDFEQG